MGLGVFIGINTISTLFGTKTTSTVNHSLKALYYPISETYKYYVGFEVFTAVVLKSIIFGI
jgi:hypothetical protein